MPTNARGMKIKGSYTPSKYQAQLKKLETKVGRASTTQARKKAQDAVRAFKRTRSKYYKNNPTDRAVRRAGAAVKKTAKKVTTAVKKHTKAVSSSTKTQRSRKMRALQAQIKKATQPGYRGKSRSDLVKELRGLRNAELRRKKAKGRKPTVTKQDQVAAKMGTMRKYALTKARGIAGAGSPPVSMRPKARRVASKSRKITGRRR